VNDLQNKKRKAIEFLKKNSKVKFYMKVNVFVEENIEKGKQMLMSIAEDLKEYAKITKSPDSFTKRERKQSQEEEGEDVAPAGALGTADEDEILVNLDERDRGEFQDEYEDRPQYLLLEVQSTVYF